MRAPPQVTGAIRHCGMGTVHDKWVHLNSNWQILSRLVRRKAAFGRDYSPDRQHGWNVQDSGGSAVKTLPAMQETQIQSLGWEDPLEKGMATHSSILAWKILRTEEPGGLQSMGSPKKLDMT